MASQALRAARDWVERTDDSSDALAYAQVQALIAIAEELELLRKAYQSG